MSEQPIKMQLNVSDRKLYPANFCRLQSTAEEFTIDFGVQTDNQQADVIAGIMLSPFTAKRLLSLLTKTIDLHEMQFGPIITDASQRRIKPVTPEAS